MVFWGDLGIFQRNHLHSNEKVGTTMIYAGLYVSGMSVEAIVRMNIGFDLLLTLAITCYHYVSSRWQSICHRGTKL
jgi:hypothetical protein